MLRARERLVIVAGPPSLIPASAGTWAMADRWERAMMYCWEKFTTRSSRRYSHRSSLTLTLFGQELRFTPSLSLFVTSSLSHSSPCSRLPAPCSTPQHIHPSCIQVSFTVNYCEHMLTGIRGQTYLVYDPGLSYKPVVKMPV